LAESRIETSSNATSGRTRSASRDSAHEAGQDLSDGAVQRGRELSAEFGVEAGFVQARVRELSEPMPDAFDIMFTSHGVLLWNPSLDLWASNIAASLRQCGTLYRSEYHPLSFAVADKQGDAPGQITLASPYHR
jgi:SAM-dependent methyltransferase